MQFAKDSFLLALQQRLGGLNPARTVTINGATVPAVVAVENLPPACAEAQPNAFYIEWGPASGDRRACGQCCADEPGMRDLVLHVGNRAKHGGSRAGAGTIG